METGGKIFLRTIFLILHGLLAWLVWGYVNAPCCPDFLYRDFSIEMVAVAAVVGMLWLLVLSFLAGAAIDRRRAEP